MTRQSKKAAANDRAAKVAQLQKQARADNRRRASTLWIALGVTMAVIVGLVAWAIVNEVNNRPDLSAIQVYDDPQDQSDNLPGDHVTTPVEYEQSPPVGGEHHPTWWNCGVYQDPIPNEHAVHALEHGAVWLTYQPGLDEDQLGTLEDYADQDYMMLSPYEDQDSPIVVTAWGHQLAVETADDGRIEEFIETYNRGPQTPEPGAACTMGTNIDLVQRG